MLDEIDKIEMKDRKTYFQCILAIIMRREFDVETFGSFKNKNIFHEPKNYH